MHYSIYKMQQIPLDILSVIIQYVPLHDLMNMEKVSQQYYCAISALFEKFKPYLMACEFNDMLASITHGDRWLLNMIHGHNVLSYKKQLCGCAPNIQKIHKPISTKLCVSIIMLHTTCTEWDVYYEKILEHYIDIFYINFIGMRFIIITQINYFLKRSMALIMLYKYADMHNLFKPSNNIKIKISYIYDKIFTLIHHTMIDLHCDILWNDKMSVHNACYKLMSPPSTLYDISHTDDNRCKNCVIITETLF
jgi:hypothetical protein